jgi:hypothetical protein
MHEDYEFGQSEDGFAELDDDWWSLFMKSGGLRG